MEGEHEVDATLAEVEVVKNMRWGGKTTYGYSKSMTEFLYWIEKSDIYSSMLDHSQGCLNSSFRASALLAFCTQKRKYNKKTGQNELLGFSGLNRYQSALQWYLKVQNLSLCKEDEEELSTYFRGTKKQEQREKQAGIRDMREGKAEIPFQVYILLAQFWWSVEDYFSLLYLLLTWNLGCRTNNTEGIRLHHISWYEDTLQIEFGITKSNQEGERLEKRLIFANSDNPFICPVLALSVYLGLRTLPLAEDGKLFDGGNQASRFQKSLTEALSNAQVKDCLVSFGLSTNDIGAHSIRKGAGTYLSTGGTQGPNPVAVCLRMSWTLGNTKERYLFTSPSSDAYCGRILAGLDQKTVRYEHCVKMQN